MLKVGLTGGIGSGKSEVARLLAAEGAVVIDADALARDAVATGSPGLAEVVASFGPQVLDSAGGLDRAALARVVFADPEARARLEAIVHPRVRQLAAAAFASAAADAPGAIVVHDVPLLVEAGLQGDYDVVVVVAASEATQLDRLVRDRGMDPADARARIAAQAPLRDKLAVADEVVWNDGTRAELAAAVHGLSERLAALTARA